MKTTSDSLEIPTAMGTERAAASEAMNVTPKETARPAGNSQQPGSAEARVKNRTPLSAYLFKAYHELVPSHKGREKVLMILGKWVARSGRPFVWRMKNGLGVGIAADDVWAGCGVGWTCLMYGTWETHVEECLRRLLRVGDVALDIGANLGYFSSLMSARVGKAGKVFAFEPVPVTLEQLQLTKLANRADNLTIMPMAVGESDTTVEMRFERGVAGNASVYNRFHASEPEVARVQMRSLDSLAEAGTLPDANFIKINVEGNELSALRGGRAYITRAQPVIIFEYNVETADSAGWTLKDVEAFLSGCGDYSFSIVAGNGATVPVNLSSIDLPSGSYVDVLAIPRHRVVTPA